MQITTTVCMTMSLIYHLFDGKPNVVGDCRMTFKNHYYIEIKETKSTDNHLTTETIFANRM